MLQCLLTGIKTIVVKTVDTDGFLLLLAYRHLGRNFPSKVFVWLGSGKLKSCFYSINYIALDLREEVCQALPFLHAYTGCGAVLSIFQSWQVQVLGQMVWLWERKLVNKSFWLVESEANKCNRWTNYSFWKIFIVHLLSPYDWHIKFKFLENAGFWTFHAQ